MAEYHLSTASTSRRKIVLISSALLLGVLAVYGATYGDDFSFVNADDDEYVTANPHVQEGITLDSLKWAITSRHAYNWHPLVWISLQLDYQLFGLSSSAFHRTNVLLHAVNTVLLFWLLQWLTGLVWRSAMVAALLGFHPAHVESVAWVTERKDVLSTLFWLLTMAAYARYAARPSIGRYLLIVVGLALGLLAKPMLVTLPVVLFLLDVWPLRRWPREQAVASSYAPASLSRLILEKLPLLLVVAATIPLTIHAQQEAIRKLDQFSVSVRLANALVAYVKYLRMMVWPSGLAIYYPHPMKAIPLWQPVSAAALLIGLSVAACWTWRRRPYLAVGWFWYLGTLVPVIGLVQVGTSEMADRYSYVPFIGLSIVLVWGIAQIASQQRIPAAALAALTTGVLTACLVLTWRQVHVWKNSETLWRHALAVTAPNPLAHEMLAQALLPQPSGHREAREHLTAAVRMDGHLPSTHGNLAALLEEAGEWDEAARNYELAMQLETSPLLIRATKEKSLAGMGRIRERQERYRDARNAYAALLDMDSANVNAEIGLAGALEAMGRYAEAQRHYEAASQREPDSAQLVNLVGRVLQRQGKFQEALDRFDHALRLQPDSASAWNNKGVTFEQMGHLDKARLCYQRAVECEPEQLLFHCNLAYALEEGGDRDSAQREYAAAFRLNPNWPRMALQEAWNLATHPDASKRNGAQSLRIAKQVCQATDYRVPQGLDVLAAAYAERGDFKEAIHWQRKVLSLLSPDLPQEIRQGVQNRIQLYEKKQPFRQPTAPARS